MMKIALRVQEYVLYLYQSTLDNAYCGPNRSSNVRYWVFQLNRSGFVLGNLERLGIVCYWAWCGRVSLSFDWMTISLIWNLSPFSTAPRSLLPSPIKVYACLYTYIQRCVRTRTRRYACESPCLLPTFAPYTRYCLVAKQVEIVLHTT